MAGYVATRAVGPERGSAAPTPDLRALDAALARVDAYRVLASAFHDPDGPEGGVRLELRILRAALDHLRVPIHEATWTAARRIARRDVRASEHRAIFGHTVAHGCPPYETEYGRRHVFGQAQDLGDLRGFYEAFGVRPRRGGERPDHVACELEFLGWLALKSAIALATADGERADVCRAAERRFIADHPGRWLPALAGRIAARAPGSGYAAVTAVAAATVAAHAGSVGALPVVLGPDDVVPITEEPDGLRFECGVDGDDGSSTEG
jgi:TorA maturation chaperone TorD